MFMSDTQHQHRVRLTIGPADMTVSDAGIRDHVARGAPFVEVAITEADLGRLLSRNSAYSGVPCTVLRHGKEEMPNCPESTRFSEFAQEVKDEAEGVAEPIDRAAVVLRKLQTLVNKPGSLKKGEVREAVEAALGSLGECTKTITDTMPFFTTMLVEHMDKVVADGKASIDAYADQRSRELRYELPDIYKPKELGSGNDE
jgi:hypothetical protein